MSSNENQELRPLAINVRAAAKMLSISTTHLGKLIRTGKIAALRIGGRKLVTISELERFVRENTKFEPQSEQEKGKPAPSA